MPNRASSIVKTLTILGLLSTLLTASLSSHARGTFNGGGGGYGTRCSFDNGATIQMYALDYVQPEGLMRVNPTIASAQSVEQILSIIQAGLEKTLPHMGASLKQFVRSINTDYTSALLDPNAKRFWALGTNPLRFLDDAASMRIPSRCEMKDGRTTLYQAIIREDRDGGIHYNVDTQVMKEMEKTGPQQLSFTYVHEWLRDFTGDAETIQKVNMLFHSIDWDHVTGAQVLLALTRIQLELNYPYFLTQDEVKLRMSDAVKTARDILRNGLALHSKVESLRCLSSVSTRDDFNRLMSYTKEQLGEELSVMRSISSRSPDASKLIPQLESIKRKIELLQQEFNRPGSVSFSTHSSCGTGK